MKMHENSLFAVLLRSPWWISLLVAVATAAASRFMLARFDMPELYAIFVAMPFLVIGSVAAWQQLRAPSAARIAGTLESLRALSWDEFSAALEDAFRREGYAVNRLATAGADLELTKAGRVSLVGGKRWKVARMLSDGISYTQIVKETGMSSTTIARIAKWLNSGMNGYKLMLDKTHHHVSHTSPRLRET